jgi:hypothetical protein
MAQEILAAAEAERDLLIELILKHLSHQEQAQQLECKFQHLQELIQS